MNPPIDKVQGEGNCAGATLRGKEAETSAARLGTETSRPTLRVGARHDVLTNRVARKVRDPRLLKLIGRYLRAGVMVEGVLRASEINVPEKNIQKFKHRIRELTGRSRGISMERRMSELRSYLRGWIGYFGLAAHLKLFDKFDQWLRRRLRMCYWKRWRFVRTRHRNLIRLGVPRRQPIRHARSRKGPWHMAKPIATGVGLTNAWLQAQGLLSLKSIWAELAPLRRTAVCGPACTVV